MHFSTLILPLAASALALPTISKREEDCEGIQPAPLNERFTVAFKVDDTMLSANFVRNGSNILLKGERMSVSPGTQAYLNTSNPSPTSGFNFVALNFVEEEIVYGAFAPEVGDAYGKAGPIFLEQNQEEFKWLVNNGSISHELQAAPNSLYACDGTLDNGEQGTFLSFGDYNYDSTPAGPPVGCAITEVYQNFNVVSANTGSK